MGRIVASRFEDISARGAAYTVRFAGIIYVLHAFQKKSTKGIATPQREMDLIRKRLADAERHFKERQRANGKKDDRRQNRKE